MVMLMVMLMVMVMVMGIVMVMVMVMVMNMNMKWCRTARQSTRRRMMCDHLEIGTISTGTEEDGTLVNATLSTRRLVMTVTRGGIVP